MQLVNSLFEYVHAVTGTVPVFFLCASVSWSTLVLNTFNKNGYHGEILIPTVLSKLPLYKYDFKLQLHYQTKQFLLQETHPNECTFQIVLQYLVRAAILGMVIGVLSFCPKR